ncbi:MAG TPA: FAD-dependent oxidoreductase [Planctomycetes bacterium]|nr:FAD-dependent oxidoreductase [Planctomycetota bacterium]HIK62076.1 FAD-dependent oxidoreductase [Planctomycetota bacterium]
MERRFDVIVVGGGVVGLACAYALLGKGRGVCVLEGEDLGNGASQGNCGLLTPSHALPLTRPATLRQALRCIGKVDSPLYVRLRLDLDFLLWGLRFARHCGQKQMGRALRARSALLERSLELTREWITTEGLECEWQSEGLLEVYGEESALSDADQVQAILSEHGLDSKRLSAQETLEREPALTASSVAGGLFHPRDAHLRPDSFVAELARAVRDRGGVIQTDCSVHEILHDDRAQRIRTSRGEWVSSQLVMATGAWGPDLARGVGLRLPIQAGKGYSLTIPSPDGAPTMPLLLHEANMAVTPWSSGLRLGGTMELSGRNLDILPGRIAALRAGGARFLDCDLTSAGDEWVGWRPMTPDELPLIGPSPVSKRILVATGHGMMGVSMCAATGDLVARLLCGEDPGIDPGPYSATRFQ